MVTGEVGTRHLKICSIWLMVYNTFDRLLGSLREHWGPPQCPAVEVLDTIAPVLKELNAASAVS